MKLNSPSNVHQKVYDFFKNKMNGFYIEAGANDGITQSNTFLLEKQNNWKGILIEPSILSYNECIKNRNYQNNIFLNCALVEDDSIKTVKGDFDGNLMSSINGERRNRYTNFTKVSANTLYSILKKNNIRQVDFFSLDVEGFEYNVLMGHDFSYCDINYMLIEIYNKDYDKIVKLLNDNNYELIENISDFNLSNNPYWDGTHNDYLFELKK